ncbi:MAG: hypothetical protein ACLVDF_09155 [Acutalibacteraceae bacterium]
MGTIWIAHIPFILKNSIKAVQIEKEQALQLVAKPAPFHLRKAARKNTNKRNVVSGNPNIPARSRLNSAAEQALAERKADILFLARLSS